MSMLGMKRDCGGAAAILGAFYATVKLVGSTSRASANSGLLFVPFAGFLGEPSCCFLSS